MDNKSTLLEILENSDGFLSGSELADYLHLTRAAVWKYIRSLRNDGYDIEAVTNRGYRLCPSGDVISVREIQKELGQMAGRFSLEVLPVCVSTNQVIRQRASSLPPWHTVIAGRQTGGRGRLGRSFYSPEGCGLYMSIFLRPAMSGEEASLITTAAAVAVCRSIEETAHMDASIKWVNDIFVRGKKVCGILTEAVLDMESRTVDYAILGVGINVTEPEGGFPPELSEIAGALFPQKQHNMRSRLAAAFLRNFYEIFSLLPSRGFVEEYRRRSFLTGRRINVIKNGGSVPALAVGIDSSCRLMVRYDDGSTESLSSGEVSVRPAGTVPENKTKI